MARGIVRPFIGPGKSAVRVRLPKGHRTFDSSLVRAVDNMDQRISNSNNCTVVFFKKGSKITAAQRCEGRRLKGHNKSQCRGKKKRFVKCAGGRRRR